MGRGILKAGKQLRKNVKSEGKVSSVVLQKQKHAASDCTIGVLQRFPSQTRYVPRVRGYHRSRRPFHGGDHDFKVLLNELPTKIFEVCGSMTNFG